MISIIGKRLCRVYKELQMTYYSNKKRNTIETVMCTNFLIEKETLRDQTIKSTLTKGLDITYLSKRI